MKSNKLWPMLALLSLFMLSGACVRYYKTSDIRKSLNSARTKTRGLFFKAQKNLKATKTALGKVQMALPDMPAATRDKLKHLLAGAEKYLEPIEAGYKQADALVKRFAVIAKNRKIIRADRPEWDKVQRIKAELEAVGDRLNKAVDAYNSKLEEFKKAINKLRTSGAKH